MSISLIGGDEHVSVKKLCQKAFTGYPWYTALSDADIDARWNKVSALPNFRCYVEKQSDVIISASWLSEMPLDVLQKEKGVELRNFVASKHMSSCIWHDATVVDPEAQGGGFARRIKLHVLSDLKKDFPNGIIITRMRDDNYGIIKINTSLGFKRSDVRVPAGTDGLFHEFWYLEL